MHNHDYAQNAIELIDKTEITRQEIYDIDLSRFKSLYEQYYNFCQENLSVTNGKYITQPARIFFSPGTDFEAGARKKWGHSLIRINRGLVETMHEIILHRFGKQILEGQSEEILEYEKKPIDVVMLQTTLLFLFYHELAHLIQIKDRDIVEREENYGFTEADKFDIEDHVMEIDADIYAANYICDHMVNFVAANATQQFFEDVVVYSMTGIFVMFLQLHGGIGEIYYEQKTHPHPFIRLSVVINVVFEGLKEKLRSVELTHLQIQEKELISQIGSICEARLNGYFEGNLPSDFLKTIRDNQSEIGKYANVLIAERNKHLRTTANCAFDVEIRLK